MMRVSAHGIGAMLIHETWEQDIVKNLIVPLILRRLNVSSQHATLTKMFVLINGAKLIKPIKPQNGATKPIAQLLKTMTKNNVTPTKKLWPIILTSLEQNIKKNKNF